MTQGNKDVLFRAAHDIKGQAATFGFPLVAPVANSLCRLIEHTPDAALLPLRLIDQHVDAVAAIVHRNTRGDVGKYAAELAEKLRHVTDEFLMHENRHRPDTLESILSPSMVPGS
jgi:HPt (histidine-containing phosphotransfer) domain-containing protein